jgi:hypothetical protein
VLVSTRRVWSGRRRPWHGGIPTAGVIPFGGCHLLYEARVFGLYRAPRGHTRKAAKSPSRIGWGGQPAPHPCSSVHAICIREEAHGCPALSRSSRNRTRFWTGLACHRGGPLSIQGNAQIFKKSLKKIVILINFILFLYYI